MPNYLNGKIYALRSHQTDDVYIGSTTYPLCTHLSELKKWKNGTNNYLTSFKLSEYDDCYIELVEYFPCDTKQELKRREGQIIRETENCVNVKL
jgi:hypothetical protein